MYYLFDDGCITFKSSCSGPRIKSNSKKLFPKFELERIPKKLQKNESKNRNKSPKLIKIPPYKYETFKTNFSGKSDDDIDIKYNDTAILLKI